MVGALLFISFVVENYFFKTVAIVFPMSAGLLTT
jgi:hypothetical protein